MTPDDGRPNALGLIQVQNTVLFKLIKICIKNYYEKTLVVFYLIDKNFMINYAVMAVMYIIGVNKNSTWRSRSATVHTPVQQE